MRRIRQYLAGTVVLMFSAAGLATSPLQAIEVLQNGGLEIGGGGPKDWTLTNSVTGDPAAFVGATELIDQGNNPGPPNAPGIGLVLKTWAGNEGPYAGQDKMVNVVLTQVTPATAGRTFTLNGDALLQQSSSSFLSTLGSVAAAGDYNQNLVTDAADYNVWQDNFGSTTNLAADSDGNGVIDQADFDFWKAHFGSIGHGPIPSPTSTFMKVEFLNSPTATTPLATQTLDLRTDTVAPDVWQTHTFTTAAAPVGTTNARVTAAAMNMVQSCTTGVDCTGGHDVYFDNFSLLQNGAFGGEKLSNGNLNVAGAPAGFTVTNTVPGNFSFSTADFSNPHGAGNTGMWLEAFMGGDVTITQTTPGVAGALYTFSVFSKWEVNFRGADPSSTTQDILKIEFLNGSSGLISSQMLDLRTVQVNDGNWHQLSMTPALAPAGTASVRVSAITTGMVVETGPLLSAFYDDFSLVQTGPGLGGAVPEPSSVALWGIAGMALGVWRRRAQAVKRRKIVLQ